MNSRYQEIIASCLSGVRTAAKKYAEWSGGVSLRSAPESITHIFIAKNLAKTLPKKRKGSKLITLEEKPSDLIRASGRSTETRKNKNGRDRIEGRVDITVWSEKEQPWLIIEVKRHSGHRSINDDVERIRTLFKDCPSIKAGFIVVVTQATNEDTLPTRFDKMAKESNTKKGGIRFLNGKTKKGTPMHACAMCFVVYRGKNTS